MEANLESKGLRLSRTKTEYMRCDFSGVGCEDAEVSLEGQRAPTRDTFRYLGSIKTGWMKWWQASNDPTSYVTGRSHKKR
jgi:hypothetical protein